jgi:hypothetical protein
MSQPVKMYVGLRQGAFYFQHYLMYKQRKYFQNVTQKICNGYN